MHHAKDAVETQEENRFRNSWQKSFWQIIREGGTEEFVQKSGPKVGETQHCFLLQSVSVYL